jgi:hypothetical protein
MSDSASGSVDKSVQVKLVLLGETPHSHIARLPPAVYDWLALDASSLSPNSNGQKIKY